MQKVHKNPKWNVFIFCKYKYKFIVHVRHKDNGGVFSINLLSTQYASIINDDRVVPLENVPFLKVDYWKFDTIINMA